MEKYITKLNAMKKCIGVMAEDLEQMRKELNPKYEELEAKAISYAKDYNYFVDLYDKTNIKVYDTAADAMYDKYLEYEDKAVEVGTILDEVVDILDLFIE